MAAGEQARGVGDVPWCGPPLPTHRRDPAPETMVQKPRNCLRRTLIFPQYHNFAAGEKMNTFHVNLNSTQNLKKISFVNPGHIFKQLYFGIIYRP